MRKLLAAPLLLLALALPAQGQDVRLEVKGGGAKVVQVDRQVLVKVDVTVVSSLPFTVQAPAGAGLYFWQYPPGVAAQDRNDRLEVTAAPKGELTVGVKMITADLDDQGRFKGFRTAYGSVTFTVGDVPQPGPPTPPDPPGPKPPAPVAGLKVLVVEESADRTRLPLAQQSVILGKTVRDRLNAVTPVGPDGRTREWRIYDKDVDASAEAPHWKALLARPRQSVPWVVLADGAGNPVFEGPLPGTVADFLALIDKYAPKSQLKKAG